MFIKRPLLSFQKEKNPGARPLKVLRYLLHALRDVLTFVLMLRIVSYSGLEYFYGFLRLVAGRHLQTEDTYLHLVSKVLQQNTEMKSASRSHSYQVMKHLGTHAMRCFWHFQYHLMFQVQLHKNHWASLDCLYQIDSVPPLSHRSDGCVLWFGMSECVI